MRLTSIGSTVCKERSLQIVGGNNTTIAAPSIVNVIKRLKRPNGLCHSKDND